LIFDSEEEEEEGKTMDQGIALPLGAVSSQSKIENHKSKIL
jgi:hypothetical protein